ncbi:MAG: hypothetical protein IT158_21145 [Bryobacterales bacterium]|nr:hypothetical protein [Bryobacterales bacterium]
MFRSLSGYKAQYHDLTLLVAEEFNEWRVMLYSPGMTIHGTRQFSVAKAQDHAVTLARNYVHERKHADLPVLPGVEWQPAGAEDWLVWC